MDRANLVLKDILEILQGFFEILKGMLQSSYCLSFKSEKSSLLVSL